MSDINLKTVNALTADERDAWTALQSADPALASPYFSLGYLDAVASVRPDVRVIVRRRAGAPITFLPLQLGIFGHARPLGGPLADHHGVIGEAQGGEDLTDLLASAGVGVMDFYGALGSQACFADHAARHDGSWVIDLSEGFDAFVDARSAAEPKAFRNLRARGRKIEAEGAVLRVQDTRPGIMEKAMSWKSSQYISSGHFDVFSVNWTQNLLQELSLKSGDDCAGLVSSLEIGGELAAVHIGMRSRSVLHYWFPVYDPKFSKLGPGLALLMDLCEALSQDGICEIHLGPGEYDFKAHLAAFQMPIVGGFAGAGPAAMARRLASGVELWSERLPLGRVSRWPGKAFRRIDLISGFRAA